MEEIIDLHIHTTNSDGMLTPFEVIDNAVKNNVSVISITDHDSIKSYNDEVISYAKEMGITLINGVELSTKTATSSVHILGYNFDINNKELNDALYLNQNSRQIYLKKVSKRLTELGFTLDYDYLSTLKSVAKSSIASNIVENNKNKSLLIKTFGYVPKRGEFIERMMNKGCPAYIKKDVLTPTDAANIIRNAGGSVVIAHPSVYIYENKMDINDITSLIRKIKPDGIEANYIYVNSNNHIYYDYEYWRLIANIYNLEVTTGSDYHFSDGLRPEIGLVNYEINAKNNDDLVKKLVLK